MAKICENPTCGNEFEKAGHYCSDDCFIEHEALQIQTQVKVKLTQIDVQKVTLNPGDVLMVTVKNDELSPQALHALREKFRHVFPVNEIFIFGMGSDGDVKFAVVSQPETSYASGCNTSPVGYCSDCNCGKKEKAESKKDQ